MNFYAFLPDDEYQPQSNPSPYTVFANNNTLQFLLFFRNAEYTQTRIFSTIIYSQRNCYIAVDQYKK